MDNSEEEILARQMAAWAFYNSFEYSKSDSIASLYGVSP